VTQIKTITDYDTNADGYDKYRRPSPIIREKLKEKFSGITGSILSLGCGTGRMEQALSESNQIFGLDYSSGMLNQAKKRVVNLIQGDMTRLPFNSESFGGAFFMQSLHHVGANLAIGYEERTQVRKQGLREAIRVIKKGPIIIIQRDPSQNKAVWFWHYFPNALKTKLVIQPEITRIIEWLNEIGLSNVDAIPINDPMVRNFYDPNSILDPSFRKSFSEFSYLSKKDIISGLEKLNEDIENGLVYNKIMECKQKFAEIGGTVFLISAKKL